MHGSYLAKVKHLGSPVAKCDPSAPQLFFACTLGTQVVHLPEEEIAYCLLSLWLKVARTCHFNILGWEGKKMY